MYMRGRVPVSWNEDFKNFNYTEDPITGPQAEEWKAQGYYHEKTYGEMFGFPNEMPEWVDTVAFNLNLCRTGFVFYKMKTLDIMPVHTDHFKKYCEVFHTTPDNVKRAIVFLEDWKSGHYFEIGGEAITNWKAGDFVIWQGNVPHSASNIGIEDRYTLQITGQTGSR